MLNNEKLKSEVVEMMASDQFNECGAELKLWRRYARLFESPAEYELNEEELSSLSIADREYAIGLESPKLADSVEHYEQALMHSPFHLRSRIELVTTLLFLGRYEHCQREVGIAQAMFPKDHRFDVVEILSHALAGKYDPGSTSEV